jgi:alkanesulfonate monooxygenase SsuD/methylene tetrahydromethanopterin reductase-like flavin-dependent oxidoreductase (luciferase family)
MGAGIGGRETMKFGVFEHMDDSGLPLGRQIADRLQLIEAYDRHGFYAYHLAEHHGTPLGLAPSPGLIMAAVAQRTKRLRFGPLVYLLPLYHPLRLIEEICMLDHMSGGRLELGVGRGVSPIEVGFFGVDPANGPRQFPEALRVIKQGLTSDVLTFEGEFYRFKDVPMVLKPMQKPHPPLWYGVTSPEASVWAAVEKANIATLVPAKGARAIGDRFRAEWTRLGHPQKPAPLVGLIRHLVLAQSEADAIATAERAYRRWRRHMELLWVQHGRAFPLALPQEFGPLLASGGAFAGTAAGARRYIADEIETSGANYFICDIAFGDIALDEAMRTVELLGRELMPHFAGVGPSAKAS